MVNFPEVEWARKWKKNSSSCVNVLHKTSHRKLTSWSCSDGKELYQKCSARVELSFCL